MRGWQHRRPPTKALRERTRQVTPSEWGSAATNGFANTRSSLTAFRARVYSMAFSNGCSAGSRFRCTYGQGHGQGQGHSVFPQHRHGVTNFLVWSDLWHNIQKLYDTSGILGRCVLDWPLWEHPSLIQSSGGRLRRRRSFAHLLQVLGPLPREGLLRAVDALDSHGPRGVVSGLSAQCISASQLAVRVAGVAARCQRWCAPAASGEGGGRDSGATDGCESL